MIKSPLEIDIPAHEACYGALIREFEERHPGRMLSFRLMFNTSLTRMHAITCSQHMRYIRAAAKERETKTPQACESCGHINGQQVKF